MVGVLWKTKSHQLGKAGPWEGVNYLLYLYDHCLHCFCPCKCCVTLIERNRKVKEPWSWNLFFFLSTSLLESYTLEDRASESWLIRQSQLAHPNFPGLPCSQECSCDLGQMGGKIRGREALEEASISWEKVPAPSPFFLLRPQLWGLQALWRYGGKPTHEGWQRRDPSGLGLCRHPVKKPAPYPRLCSMRKVNPCFVMVR